MRHVADFADQRHKAWCIHCHGWLSLRESNRDHVPSKVLLEEPLPANLPVISICRSCNSSFSADEEYTAAFLSAVLSGTTEPASQKTRSGARILARNGKLLERIKRTRKEYQTTGGETKMIWTPEIGRIQRVVLKNARGHVYYETGEPYFAEPTSIWCLPLVSLTANEREHFEGTLEKSEFAAWPEVGSRLMTRLLGGDDFEGGWITVQPSVYRYSVNQGAYTVIRSVIHEYLATEVCWGNE